jgi:hypothetical protein
MDWKEIIISVDDFHKIKNVITEIDKGNLSNTVSTPGDECTYRIGKNSDGKYVISYKKTFEE